MDSEDDAQGANVFVAELLSIVVGILVGLVAKPNYDTGFSSGSIDYEVIMEVIIACNEVIIPNDVDRGSNIFAAEFGGGGVTAVVVVVVVDDLLPSHKKSICLNVRKRCSLTRMRTRRKVNTTIFPPTAAERHPARSLRHPFWYPPGRRSHSRNTLLSSPPRCSLSATAWTHKSVHPPLLRAPRR